MNQPRVVGTSYRDTIKFSDSLTGCRWGGIHNFMRAYPCKDWTATEYIDCEFKQHEGKLIKVGQTWHEDPNHPVRIYGEDTHFCYGDSYEARKVAEECLPFFPVDTFISVDMIECFQHIETHVLEFWKKYADIMFIATEEPINYMPRIVESSACFWVLHNPRFVTVINPAESKDILTVNNVFYEPMLDTIGAGDYFAGKFLEQLYDPAVKIVDTLKVMEDVAEMLRKQNGKV
jgi:hypothetical protein